MNAAARAADKFKLVICTPRKCCHAHTHTHTAMHAQEAVERECGGMRWGEFKPVLSEAVVEHLRPIQTRYNEVMGVRAAPCSPCMVRCVCLHAWRSAGAPVPVPAVRRLLLPSAPSTLLTRAHWPTQSHRMRHIWTACWPRVRTRRGPQLTARWRTCGRPWASRRACAAADALHATSRPLLPPQSPFRSLSPRISTAVCFGVRTSSLFVLLCTPKLYSSRATLVTSCAVHVSAA